MTNRDNSENSVTTDEHVASNRPSIDRDTTNNAKALGQPAFGDCEASPVAASHEPATKPAATGSTVEVLSSPKGTKGSQVRTLLEIPNVETSGSEQDTLIFRPTVESSLFTRVKNDGGRANGKQTGHGGTVRWDPVANAGVFAWIEIRGDATDGSWRMVDIEGTVRDQPLLASPDDFVDRNGNLSKVADSVVTFNSRNLTLGWFVEDLIDTIIELPETGYGESEEFDLLLDLLYDLLMRSRSVNGFNWIARDVDGVNDLRLRGAVYDFTYGNAEARAVVGNRSMVVEAMQLSHDVY